MPARVLVVVVRCCSPLNLKIVEIPVRYHAPTDGSTQMSRFRRGWLLLRMVIVGWRKLEAV